MAVVVLGPSDIARFVGLVRIGAVGGWYGRDTNWVSAEALQGRFGTVEGCDSDVGSTCMLAQAATVVLGVIGYREGRTK